MKPHLVYLLILLLFLTIGHHDALILRSVIQPYLAQVVTMPLLLIGIATICLINYKWRPLMRLTFATLISLFFVEQGFTPVFWQKIITLLLGSSIVTAVILSFCQQYSKEYMVKQDLSLYQYEGYGYAAVCNVQGSVI